MVSDLIASFVASSLVLLSGYTPLINVWVILPANLMENNPVKIAYTVFEYSLPLLLPFSIVFSGLYTLFVDKIQIEEIQSDKYKKYTFILAGGCMGGFVAPFPFNIREPLLFYVGFITGTICAYMLLKITIHLQRREKWKANQQSS